MRPASRRSPAVPSWAPATPPAPAPAPAPVRGSNPAGAPSARTRSPRLWGPVSETPGAGL